MVKSEFKPYNLFYDQMIQYLRVNLAKQIRARNPVFRVRSNRLQIILDGIRGSHYEMCFRRDYHEFALHFESTAARSISRRQAFDPLLHELSQKIGHDVRSGPHENQGWMRVWLQIPPTEPILPLLEKYEHLFLRFIEATYPVLEEVYVREAMEIKG